MEKENHFGKVVFTLLILLLLLFLGIATYSHKHNNDVTLTELSVIQNGSKTQLILGFSNKPDYQIVYANNSTNLMIDIRNCHTIGKFAKPSLIGTIISRIHSEKFDKNIGLQLALDLRQALAFASEKDSVLQDNRLIINLNPNVVATVPVMLKTQKTVVTTKNKSQNKKISHAKITKKIKPILCRGDSCGRPNHFNIKSQSDISNFLKPCNSILQLSTNDFGWIMPITLGAEYSEIFGAMLHGSFAHSLGLENAIALLFDVGNNEYRLNGTLGHVFSEHQRLKLTTEYLAQNLDFSFKTGPLDKWVGQGAAGLTYEYLFPGRFLHDLNLNAFYSKAWSKDLGPKIFSDPTSLETGLSEDWRRIAGGIDKSASFGLDLLPFKTTLLGLQVNYDNLHYDMIYPITADNPDPSASGLGGTLTLDQLLGKYFKLKLLGSKRKIYDVYQAELAWLVKSNADHHLEISLFAEHLINDNSAQSSGLIKNTDNRIGLNFAYQFGNGQSSDANGYTLEDKNSQGDIVNWTGSPAVHMEKVLAVKDEMIQHIKAPQVSDFEADCTINTPCDLDITNHFDFGADSLTNILNELLAAAVLPDNQKLAYYNLSLNLFAGGHIIKLTGTSPRETPDGNPVVIPIVMFNSAGISAPGSFHLRINAGEPTIDGFELDEKVGVPIHASDSQGVDITSHIHDGASGLKNVTQPDGTPTENLLSYYGLTLVFNKDEQKVYISGTPNKPTNGVVEIPVEIENTGNIINKKASFKLLITGSDYQIQVFDVTAFYGKELSKTAIAKINTNGDESLEVINKEDIANEVAPYNLIEDKTKDTIILSIDGSYTSPTPLPGPTPKNKIVMSVPIQVDHANASLTRTSKPLGSNDETLTIDVPPTLENIAPVSIDHNINPAHKVLGAVDCGGDNDNCKIDASGLPDGFTVKFDDTKENILLDGAGNLADTYSVTVSVTNRASNSSLPPGSGSTKSFDLTINPVAPIVFKADNATKTNDVYVRVCAKHPNNYDEPIGYEGSSDYGGADLTAPSTWPWPPSAHAYAIDPIAFNYYVVTDADPSGNGFNQPVKFIGAGWDSGRLPPYWKLLPNGDATYDHKITLTNKRGLSSDVVTIHTKLKVADDCVPESGADPNIIN